MQKSVTNRYTRAYKPYLKLIFISTMPLENLPFSRENFEALKAGHIDLLAQMAELKFQFEEIKRLVFGTKSERFMPQSTPGAPTLFDLPAKEAVVDTIEKTITVSLKKKNEGHPGRNPLPGYLPREITVLEPAEDVTGLTLIGQDITEQLDYTAGKLIVRQFIRPKYARPKGAGIVTADLPEFPITMDTVVSGLLTQLIISKFVDGLPIYRQVEIFKRQGVELSTATIAGWIRAATELLFPLYENLQKQVLSSRFAQVDETRLQVLDRLIKGKSVRGWIWAYHAPLLRLVMFDYAQGRGKENPVKHLQHFQGYLQTDGYGVYDGFGLLPGITLLSCWAHTRREFFEAKDYDLPRAEHILGEIGLLYDLERTRKGLSDAERKRQREETALPVLDRLHAYMLSQQAAVLPASPMGKALNYALKR